MGLIGAIILGILAGFIANKIMGKGGGLLWDLFFGNENSSVRHESGGVCHNRHLLFWGGEGCKWPWVATPLHVDRINTQKKECAISF